MQFRITHGVCHGVKLRRFFGHGRPEIYGVVRRNFKLGAERLVGRRRVWHIMRRRKMDTRLDIKDVSSLFYLIPCIFGLPVIAVSIHANATFSVDGRVH